MDDTLNSDLVKIKEWGRLTLYKALILPMVLHGGEAWTLSNTDVAALGVFERKMLRKISGPVRVGDDYHIRTNLELYELYNDMDVANRINNQRFRWVGHIVRMDEDAPPSVLCGGWWTSGWDDRVSI